ncbi:MAG: hypothetical protein J6W09_04705 [Bacteroidales bacterium]|nr:hypothetical protein [Bacteroidales bacterium]
MPIGKTYSKSQHKWVDTDKERKQNYDAYDADACALLVSYWRWYPDKFLDLIESENSDYSLELIQRVNLRAFCRYQNVFVTGSRGTTKTYAVFLSDLVKGVLWPGIQQAYYGPSLKQTADICAKTWKQIEKNYPMLAAMWNVVSMSSDRFVLETKFGSRISITAMRGDNIHCVTAEEAAQEETGQQFDYDQFEAVVTPAVRLLRMVGKKPDINFPQNQFQYITSAGSQQNRAFEKRLSAYKEMREGKSAFAIDIPSAVSVVSGIRTISWLRKLKGDLTPDKYLREAESIWTGTSENPILKDLTLTQSKTLTMMEYSHCGNLKSIYVIGNDNSYRDGGNNAKCAYAVFRCDPKDGIEAGTFDKKLVYVQDNPPPKEALEQARQLKAFWLRYTMKNAEPAYIAIDARAYGTSVIEFLHKDLKDGLPPLCCMNHDYAELELPGALPVIYPIIATGGFNEGVHDSDAAMIEYAEREWEHGNVQMLISNIQEGLKAYKLFHKIKTDEMDVAISYPYLKTRELCGQIGNLKKRMSGFGFTEERISKSIQRDMWSAAKYALRVIKILEDRYKAIYAQGENPWSKWSESVIHGMMNNTPVYGTRTAARVKGRCVGRIGGNGLG